MERIQGILFDKDGTLYDFQATWGRFTADFLTDFADGDADLLAAMAEELAFDPATRRFRPGSVAIAGTTFELASALVPYLSAFSTATTLAAELDLRAEAVVLEPAVPLPPLFERLKARGLVLGLATNDTESAARAQLEASSALEHMDFIAGYDSGHGHKPGPGQMNAFARAMALPPEVCAMVGDSSHDLLAGKAAGMVAVAVLTGVATKADLSPLADVVLPDIGALPDWLDTL